jgi:hypothetical protein
MIHLCDAPTLPATRSDIYFPFIAIAPTPLIAGLTPTCAAFLRLLLDDDRQEHPSLTVCASLILSATRRAEGLANGQPWSHCDAQNICSNAYARDAGCVLPDWYQPNGNQVETLGAGSDNVLAIYEALTGSEKHSEALFGRGWFRHQTHIGIAMATGGVYGWYWVFHLAKCAE